MRRIDNIQVDDVAFDADTLDERLRDSGSGSGFDFGVDETEMLYATVCETSSPAGTATNAACPRPRSKHVCPIEIEADGPQFGRVRAPKR